MFVVLQEGHLVSKAVLKDSPFGSRPGISKSSRLLKERKAGNIVALNALT